MLVNLYSIPVYKIKLPEHEQVQQDFADILDKEEYFSKVPSWYSPVDTTYGNPDASNLPFKTFIRSAITGLNEYLENFSIDLTLDYRIECWLNKYKPGSYQEVHNHVGVAQISCAYMMHTPKDSGNFVFYNKAYDFFHQSGLPALSTQPFRYNNRVTPPLEEGDIVIWNLRTHHCGTSRRLKLFPKICLQPHFEKLLPNFLFLPTQYKENRCAIFTTFAKNDLNNKNIFGYIKKKLNLNRLEKLKSNSELVKKFKQLGCEFPDIIL